MKIDVETFRDFSRYKLLHANNRRSLKILVAVVPSSLLLCIFGLVVLRESRFYIFSYASALTIILYAFFYFYQPDSVYRQNELLPSGESTYRFYDDRVEQIHLNTNIYSLASYQYTAFKEIHDANSAFYLVLVNDTCLILAKRYMDAGEISYLQDFLANRFSNVFKSAIA
ncbi:MAG: hypothetical protein FWD45_01150 [Coriobacteriia bacterium]|nr:hypothetical protein [Coriobacteriia bacterium]